jgi:hypothetical protein
MTGRSDRPSSVDKYSLCAVNYFLCSRSGGGVRGYERPVVVPGAIVAE